MQLPEELYYTENHEWILVEEEVASVGITEHAVEEMGDVVFVELPEAGEQFEQYDSFGVVESVKAVSDIYLPAGGTVTEINEDLLNQPELINEEPYEGGWMVKITLTDQAEIESLMDYESYHQYLERG
ncbi:MAG: glycine cleavage system protein GcvH [Halanaerobiaceae bacterium]